MKRSVCALLLGLVICAGLAWSLFPQVEEYQPPAPTQTATRDKAVPAAPLPADDILSGSFTDVPSSAPYYDAVCYAVYHNIIQGMGDGTFAPDHPVSRGGRAVPFEPGALARL